MDAEKRLLTSRAGLALITGGSKSLHQRTDDLSPNAGQRPSAFRGCMSVDATINIKAAYRIVSGINSSRYSVCVERDICDRRPPRGRNSEESRRSGGLAYTTVHKYPDSRCNSYEQPSNAGAGNGPRHNRLRYAMNDSRGKREQRRKLTTAILPGRRATGREERAAFSRKVAPRRVGGGREAGGKEKRRRMQSNAADLEGNRSWAINFHATPASAGPKGTGRCNFRAR
ncbi:hypothetical protein KM043_016986 [Ampulex compressa]|nr:hypothetical protein KM043_016986 [Ampulex compressa]